MADDNAERFRSLRLLTRSRRGRPPRRQIGWPLATAFTIIGVVVAATTYARADLLAAVLAAGGTIALLAALWYPLNAPFIALGRNRVTALLSRFGDDGEHAFAIRTTATFDRFPPRESGLLHDYIRPWHGYQIALLGETGIELRQERRGGQSPGARLRYSRIDAVSVGTATFGNFTERAILIGGYEKGLRYEVGIVPIRATSLTLAPVDEEQFERVLTEISTRVAAVVELISGSSA